MNDTGLVSPHAAEGLPPGYRMHGVPDEELTGEKGSAKNPLTATLSLHRGYLFGWKLERCRRREASSSWGLVCCYFGVWLAQWSAISLASRGLRCLSKGLTIREMVSQAHVRVPEQPTVPIVRRACRFAYQRGLRPDERPKGRCCQHLRNTVLAYS